MHSLITRTVGLLVAATALGSAPLVAQATGTVRGTVTEADTRAPLPLARWPAASRGGPAGGSAPRADRARNAPRPGALDASPIGASCPRWVVPALFSAEPAPAPYGRSPRS